MARRILVVEDNPKNLKLVRDVLQYSGFEVAEAQTAEEGVALAGQDPPPDLILMDLQLPGMGGEAALALLRRNQATRSVPVVAVTAFAMRNDRDRALAAGFDGYIEKPISVRALPGQVTTYLRPESEPRR